jgi:type IV pilus assembly protein PilM
VSDGQSIWKKEISLKRKPKAPKARPAQPEDELTEPQSEVPWWKKEITLSRKPKQRAKPEPTLEVVAPERPRVDAAEPAAEPVPEPELQSVERQEPLPPLPAGAEVVYAALPGWAAGPELELEPELEPEPEPESQPQLEAAAVEQPALRVAEPEPSASEPQVPWWKKEISLGPKRGPKSAARKKKVSPLRSASATPRAPGLPKPNLRRELSLPRPTLPKLSQLSLHARGGGHPRAKGGDAKLKRVVGLKIGASQIAAASVANNGHAELLQVVREPLDPGVVVGGELRDPEALTASLRAFFTRHKLPRKNVRLGIASNRIGVRIFDLAGIEDDKALKNAIQFRAQDALPIPLDEAVLDYQVLSESVDEEGRPTRRVLLVVAYRELVERYVAACREAGLVVVGVDLEAFALLRALGAPRPAGEDRRAAATVAVSIGHERSTFAVTDGRVCEFTRVLEWGGSALNFAIARALDRAPSEVEAVKRSLSLAEGGRVPEGLTAADAEAAVSAIRAQVQTFARELVASLQFYQHQPGSLGIEEIVVTGGTVHLSGLGAELERLIGVPVRIGDPLARVRIAKKVAAAEQVGSLAVAIGLGIED